MKDLTKKLSEILSYGLAKDYTSVSYAIMKDGKLLASDSLGHQGKPKKEPATTKCTYNVASVSKIFCTVAVMQLVEKGLLDLDKPVHEYLERFYMPDERYKKITLRHCLSHTSGLPGTQWKGFSVSSVKDANYYDDVYAYMAHSRLKAEPGEYAVYCNDGFTIAEMVVAEVSGKSYSDYCLNHITEPIGAHSTRLSFTKNPDYPLVHEGKGPAELLLIQGGAGITTNMEDLCTFGQLFLEENEIISETSKKEMAKRHGRTFLENDQRSVGFGLGWDSVSHTHPNYDLGPGALLKGGNSLQFTTQFIVVPKYNAVLAISETHDCKIDVGETILRLFAVAMLEQGVNIYKKYVPLEQDFIKKYQGTYLVPSGILNIHLYGAHASVTLDDTRGGRKPWLKHFNYDGKELRSEENRTLLFEEHGENTYALSEFNGITAPMAQKAVAGPPLSQAWKDRAGKKYVVVDAGVHDIVINNLMTGFVVNLLPNFEGIAMLSFSGKSDSGVYGLFEGAVKPLDDNCATGFLNTPGNPSRDLLTPTFEIKDGVEHCTVASYTYKDVDCVHYYEGQGFKEELQKENEVYWFPYELGKLPEIPEGRRLMILDEKLTCVYDSLTMDTYKPAKTGYLVFVY